MECKQLVEFTVDGHQHEALLPIILGLDGVDSTTAILDLGCGTGACLARLAGAGFRNLTGVDRNVENFGAQEFSSFTAADLMNGDLAELKESSFGLVTAIEVIEHVSNPERIIEVAARCLAPRGWLMITTPNIYSIRARTRFLLSGDLDFFERQAAPDHIHPLVLGAFIRHILPRYPFTLERVWPYPLYGSLGSRWFARAAAGALSMVLPNDLPGDTLCLLLRKD
jgi:2-polyprenyl-3-methyl-5-hydroxy-6-metoxy-1,4-benzoquinol methylase